MLQKKWWGPGELWQILVMISYIFIWRHIYFYESTLHVCVSTISVQISKNCPTECPYCPTEAKLPGRVGEISPGFWRSGLNSQPIVWESQQAVSYFKNLLFSIRNKSTCIFVSFLFLEKPRKQLLLFCFRTCYKLFLFNYTRGLFWSNFDQSWFQNCSKT